MTVLIPIKGISAAKERVEGKEPVKGATMDFKKKIFKQPYGDD